ncbi:MAG TPA: hypothetical protein VE642_05320 [Pyrinomonadaceae bacterium]|jgi:hypothetical protein|nr:hypothetical protein [Pyrinomonadaceae bacterium]
MRRLIPCILLLAGLVCAQATASAASTGSATIRRRRVVIVRKGELARKFPERRRAVISYPLVSGVADRAALKKIRALLDVKNVFDTSVAEYGEDAWLTEFGYKVNYNSNDILDITFRQEGVGAYPDSQERHFAVSLKTGDVIKAADAFEPASLPRLAEMANARLRAEVAETVKAVSEDREMDDEGKSSAKESLEALTFTAENLDDFMVTDKGVTFLYDAGFPHVIKALEPDGRYFFSYEQLAPYVRRGGPLGIFVK